MSSELDIMNEIVGESGEAGEGCLMTVVAGALTILGTLTTAVIVGAVVFD